MAAYVYVRSYGVEATEGLSDALGLGVSSPAARVQEGLSGVRGGDASRVDPRWSNKNRPAMERVVQDVQSYDIASGDHGF